MLGDAFTDLCQDSGSFCHPPTGLLVSLLGLWEKKSLLLSFCRNIFYQPAVFHKLNASQTVQEGKDWDSGFRQVGSMSITTV